MVKRLIDFLNRFPRPLRQIEYVISLSTVAIAVVTIIIIHQDFFPDSTSIGKLLEKYETISTVIIAMALIAIIDLVTLIRGRNGTETRAVSMFSLSVGFFFLAILTLLSAGYQNLLWVNSFTLFFISSILYFNLKVGTKVER